MTWARGLIGINSKNKKYRKIFKNFILPRKAMQSAIQNCVVFDFLFVMKVILWLEARKTTHACYEQLTILSTVLHANKFQ